MSLPTYNIPTRSIDQSGLIADLNLTYAQVKLLTEAFNSQNTGTTPTTPTQVVKVPTTFKGPVAPGFALPSDTRLLEKIENTNVNIIIVSGEWDTDPNTVIYSGGSVKYSRSINPILKISFYGADFTPLSHTSPQYADYEVWENGVKVGTVVTSADAAPFHLLTTIVLPEGLHELELRFLNPNGDRTCVFDAWVLTASETPFTNPGGTSNATAGNGWCGVLNPLDFKGDTFSDRYEAAVEAALVSDGSRAVIVTEYAQVRRAILPTHDFSLFVPGRIQRAPTFYDNIIRAESLTTTPLRNVKIIGLGNGTIAGVVDGWGSDTPTNVGSQYWRSTALLFANVENFEVSGLQFYDTNSWATCFEQCRFGKVLNTTFDQRHGSQNQDGHDIRDGSHDMTIDMVSGATYDDIIAMTNLPGYLGNKRLGDTILEIDKLTGNLRTEQTIYNINIKNVNRAYTAQRDEPLDDNPHHFWGGILLLGSSKGGRGIRNVTIDGVTGPQQIYVAFDSASINYTDNNPSGVNDISNINISNTNEAGIFIRRPIKNSSFINVARTDIYGKPSVIFQPGSRNVSRKYQDGKLEEFDLIS